MSEAVKRSLSQALNSGVRKYGTSIVSNLAIAIKTTQLYSFAHQNVVQALKELEEYILSFIKLEGEAEISRIEEFLFINEVRIKVDLGGIQPYEFIVKLLAERGIGSISFAEGLRREELSKLVDLLNHPVPPEGDPWKWFESELAKTRMPSIRVARYEMREEIHDDLSDDKRVLAINLYFRAVQQTRETLDAVRNHRKINFKRLKRTIQSMVDMVLEDEPTLLALVNIKDHGSRMANHAVNVAILSVALGTKLGLSKKLLGDLGIAAILHDLGKVPLPSRLLETAPGELSTEERKTLDDHVYAGVELLLGQRIVDAVVKSMNVAFLHHFRYDSTGFPRTHVVKAQNLYSRIVAVSDFYDNQSAPPPGGGASCPPDRILRSLMDGSGTEFDPLVVKAFVNLLGLYPVGCLVCLDDGSVGTVVSPPKSSRHLDRPVVSLFSDADGNSIDETVDLMEKSGGAFVRSILELYQQEQVELEMEEYLSVI